MADNPFGSKVKAPKADPNIGRLAGVAEKLGLESAGLGRDTLDWAKELDTFRFDTAKPIIAQQGQVATDNLQRGQASGERYRTGYQPLEDVQRYDSLGAGWLSIDEQHKIADQTAATETQALDQALKSGRMSTAEYNRQKAAVTAKTATAKQMMGVSKAAEDSASSRAMADAAAGEGRYIEGLDAEAARMGVDPSRVLAGAGANAPAAAAAAVHGGNTARFGFREGQSEALARGVNTGRAIESDADQGYGLALTGGNSAVANTNATANASIAGRTAPASYYGQALSGVGAALGGYNTAFNQQNAAYQSEAERDSGVLNALGTAAGIAWASKRDLKQNNAPAATEDTLSAIDGMDVDLWDYKPGVEDGGRHVGPYADQMAGLGLSDGESVNPMDTAGLALAGVKALIKRFDALGLEDAAPKRKPSREYA